MQRLALSVLVVVAAWLAALATDAHAQYRRGYSNARPQQSGGITWRTHRPSPSASTYQQYQRPVAPVERVQPLRTLTPIQPVTPVRPLQPLTSVSPLRPLSTSPLYRPQTSGSRSSSTGSSGSRLRQ